MNINTLLLLLLVFAAYTNLYLTLRKKGKRKINRTELPISSKEWDNYQSDQDSYKVKDQNFKSWIKNKERLEK